jgi:hypothetical protein
MQVPKTMCVARAIAVEVARIADLTPRKPRTLKKTKSQLVRKRQRVATATEVTTITAEDAETVVITAEVAVREETAEVTAVVLQLASRTRTSTPTTHSVITRARVLLRPLQVKAMLEASQLAVVEVDAVETAVVATEAVTEEPLVKVLAITTSTGPLAAVVETEAEEEPMLVPAVTASEHLAVQRVSWIEGHVSAAGDHTKAKE